MSIPKFIVCAAKKGWKWQWEQLMNGLGPADKEGEYTRPKSIYQNSSVPLSSELKARPENQLPTLIIGKTCPWAHRTWLIYELRNLKDYLNLRYANANHNSGRWEMDNPFLGCNSLKDIYLKCGSDSNMRATVPVLIDPKNNIANKPQILGNESSQLIKTLNKWPSELGSIDLEPTQIKEEINEWLEILQTNVNNGVYKCGFARNQKSYNDASNKLFKTLNLVEQSLAKKGPWLCGEELTLSDICLFTTLIRWETIYLPLFKCSQEMLYTFPNIWHWRKRLFKIKEVKKTCDSKIWSNDYFGALFPLNPGNIIPNTPDLEKIVNEEPKFKV